MNSDIFYSVSNLEIDLNFSKHAFVYLNQVSKDSFSKKSLKAARAWLMGAINWIHIFDVVSSTKSNTTFFPSCVQI